jgi:hypothetical protein
MNGIAGEAVIPLKDLGDGGFPDATATSGDAKKPVWLIERKVLGQRVGEPGSIH